MKLTNQSDKFSSYLSAFITLMTSHWFIYIIVISFHQFDYCHQKDEFSSKSWIFRQEKACSHPYPSSIESSTTTLFTIPQVVLTQTFLPNYASSTTNSSCGTRKLWNPQLGNCSSSVVNQILFVQNLKLSTENRDFLIQ